MPPTPPCPVDREVGDGEVRPFGGGARVVHTPGHTEGSIGVHLPGPRVLFTGDTVAEHAGTAILRPVQPRPCPRPASFRRLTALDVDLADVGHGEPLAGSVLDGAEPGPFGAS
jgi:glyoxylase-like metal-dependent hydrolase (beta-lactamase superfamily II)